MSLKSTEPRRKAWSKAAPQIINRSKKNINNLGLICFKFSNKASIIVVTDELEELKHTVVIRKIQLT